MFPKVRLFTAIFLVLLFLISGLVLTPEPSNPLDDTTNNYGNDALSTPGFRPTRAGSPWSMYRNNPTHTGYTTDSGPITDEVLWVNSTSGRTLGSPAVVGNKAFIGSGNGMNAFNIENGTLAWRTPTYNSVPGGYGVSSSPAYSNGHVYFGGDGIYCLYENNGTVKWFVDTPHMNYGDGTPTLANGKVFIPGSDRRLYCIDQDDGTVLWTFQTGSGGSSNYGLFAAPAVVNGLVYLAACDWNLYQINETQATSVASANHTFNMAYASYSAPVVANGRVFVGCGYTGTSTNNRFYCLDASDLSLIWEFYPGSSTSFFSSAGYYNNRVYIGSVDGNLYCLDATSSTADVIWQYSIGSTWCSPAITNERLYIGTRTNYFYCFNLSQTPGSENYYWRYGTLDDINSSPAVVDGRVYVGYGWEDSPNGGIYCFGTSDPSILPPESPTGFSAVLDSNDVRLSWNASFDDGSGQNDVAGYTVYRSSTGVNGVYELWAWITAMGSPSYEWTDTGAGDGNPNDYFYIVRANDTFNNEEQNENKVGKVVNNLQEGWNLISLPLIQVNTSMQNVLQTLDLNYEILQSYHAGKSRPWLHWEGNKPSELNQEILMTREYGYYMYLTTSDSLHVAGPVPISTQITLKTGWNLVGYPSLLADTRDNSLSSISGNYDKVEFFDTSWGGEVGIGSGDLMYPGYGYWVHATADSELIL